MHIIRAFTHLQVRRISERYILKRYTRDAKEEVTWDRHDDVRIGAQASKEQCRMSKLLPKLMRLGRAGSKSDHAFEEANRQLDKITPGIEMFPRSANDESSGPAPPASGSVEQSGSAGTNSPPSSAPVHAGMLLIEPPMSRTKGRGPGKQKKNDVQAPLNGTSLSTYTKVNYGDRQCSICGVRGTHYSTTCPMNPDRSKSAEMRAARKNTKKNDGHPRKRGRPKIVKDLHDESDLSQDELSEDELPVTRARSAATDGRVGQVGAENSGRQRRAKRVKYQE